MQVLKVEFEGKLLRLRLQLPEHASESQCFRVILKTICDGFGWNDEELAGVVLKYKDEEGDLCDLVEATVEDFLEHHAAGPLRLFVSRDDERSNLREAGKEKEKIAIIGSGNWGSVIARIAAQNTLKHPEFDDEVRMWVFEETIGPEHEKLSDIINQTHVNVKYLPGIYLGDNVVAEPDLSKAVEGASMLVFVTPHQYIKGLCPQIKRSMRKDARAISLIKGMDVTETGIQLISHLISQELGCKCACMMGANIAQEIALEKFSEATVGYLKKSNGMLWQKAFYTEYFHVHAVHDVSGCELCGTLKNIVALGAGFVDGLNLGNNTKAAIMRIGLMEMRKLAQACFPSVRSDTFYESCGVADVIATSMGGRNRRCACAYAKNWAAGTPKTWEELEKSELDGQKLQGVLTSHEVQALIVRKGLVSRFPLFTTINRIVRGELRPDDIIRYDVV